METQKINKNCQIAAFIWFVGAVVVLLVTKQFVADPSDPIISFILGLLFVPLTALTFPKVLNKWFYYIISITAVVGLLYVSVPHFSLLATIIGAVISAVPTYFAVKKYIKHLETK